MLAQACNWTRLNTGNWWKWSIKGQVSSLLQSSAYYTFVKAGPHSSFKHYKWAARKSPPRDAKLMVSSFDRRYEGGQRVKGWNIGWKCSATVSYTLKVGSTGSHRFPHASFLFPSLYWLLVCQYIPTGLQMLMVLIIKYDQNQCREIANATHTFTPVTRWM